MLKARAKLACSIAGIEPQKLNEAVHFGHLACVPETRPGAVRIFDADSIVMLSIFARLVNIGLVGTKAGEITCALYREFRVSPMCTEARFFQYENDSSCVQILPIGDDPRSNPLWPAQHLFYVAFDIAALRQKVAEALETEFQTLGTE